MKTFRIGSKESDQISISVLSYERPPSEDFYDNNWVTSQISVSTGAFAGQFNAALTTQDFVVFMPQLESLFNTLKGEAKFQTIEGQIEFTLSGNGRGGIEVTGFAIDRLGDGNQLQFRYEIDQTFLPPALRQLHEIISEFPTRPA
jgi:hypothetical protein